METTGRESPKRQRCGQGIDHTDSQLWNASNGAMWKSQGQLPSSLRSSPRLTESMTASSSHWTRRRWIKQRRFYSKSERTACENYTDCKQTGETQA